MGALIAGVMISTFPYTLDVAAKVTSLRDFFVTLFFVGLGMEIPVPTVSCLAWTLFVCVVLVASRLVTVFPVLYSLRQGFRVSLLPAINLCQMSELSLVLLALGQTSGDVSGQVVGIAAFAFSFLAIGSTYAILGNDSLLRKAVPWLHQMGLRDLDHTAFLAPADAAPRRVCLLGFSGTASSLLAEIERHRPDLLPELCVIDFNPDVHMALKARHLHAVYGDITARDVLHHAGAARAEIILCSLPNTLLKGANNLKILRQLRELNPRAKIIVHAERLADLPDLYAAGANYVTAPRLLEAANLLNILEAAEQQTLDRKRDEQEMLLKERCEVVP
jgi:Kef-type K+ transport system membrane component KefB